MPNKDQSEDKSRRRKFEDVATKELGLTELEVRRGQFSAPCRAVVEIKALGSRETPDVFPLTKLQVVAVIAEKHGERIRVVAHGGYFIDGVVAVGGNDGADSEGVGGLWTVVSISKHAEDAAALAIQRASLHRTFRKDQLPDGVKAIPEGLFKDARAAGEKSFSLWCDQRLQKVSNRRLQANALAALMLAGQRAEQVQVDVPALAVPRLLVAADDIRELQPRFMATDTADSDLLFRALDLIDDNVAWRSARGRWDIDGLCRAGVSGQVKEILPSGCVVECGDEDKIFETPTEQVVELIRMRTGFYVPNLQLVPLVKAGERVGPETCLFGPTHALPRAARQQVRRLSEAMADEGAWLHGARLMALLASSIEIDGRAHYPIELVTPSDAKQVFVQVAGDGIRGRWDARIQRISLDRHPSKHLMAAGLGFKFDLYETSHRAVALQRIKEFRQRAKTREMEDRKAKRAAQQEARNQRSREKATAKSAEAVVETEAEPEQVDTPATAEE